ncbi:MAG: pseudouridine synthase [Firmicutes bacterium]|nr:pseudouridine synthase [Bacillota bacterium]MDD4694306.1 pseudouridine synthase [Bacillota bacterium]
MERLDKIISHAGKGTRKQVRALIKSGSVTVDGDLVSDPGFKIDPEHVKIEVDGELIYYTRYVYLMLNKPAGFITATEDTFHNTVLDLIDPEDRRKDIFPVGRLDKDTEGLLLLTNDGPLAHMLLAPRYKIPKKYCFETIEEIDKNSLSALLTGVDLGDYVATATSVRVLGSNNAELVIEEGKFHQVKRMCAAVGYTIIYLERTEFGPLLLDRKIPRGSYRYLTEKEIDVLREAVR